LSWQKLGIAATLAFLVVFTGYFAWKNMNKPLHYKLYANYYSNPFDEENRVLARSETIQADGESWESFAMAIHLMEQNEFHKSAEILESINYVEDDILMDEIDWYLALCYLRTGNVVVAKDLFLEILNSDSVHSSAARSIYEELMD